MKRVLVIGSFGSGKTTVARQLAQHTGLPLIHLDVLYWRPGWVPMPPDEWVAKVRQVVQGQQWIIDGYYGGTLDVRLKACDTVVFLDLSRLVCLWRVVKRWARHVGRDRPDVAPGCPERLSWEFLKWIWTYSRRQRADILRRLAALEDAKRVIVLDSRRAVRVFFAQFGTAA